jgi:hypothetical protein
VTALYLTLAVMGAIVPSTQFVPWLVEHGFDIPGLVSELFSTRIGAFFGLDVIVSAVVLIVFVLDEGRRGRIRSLWLPIAATCLIGVSCGLPLFLWLRERQRTARTLAEAE